MIKAVIFDLNGIFLQTPKLSESEKAKREAKIPILEFMRRLKAEEKISSKMVALARELKDKGIKVFLLSNALKEAAEYYHAEFPSIYDAVDKVYYSFETGFKKPDLRAWENLLTDNGLLPKECIYFDDQEKHMEACEKTGIKSFLFTGEEDLENKIRN